MNDINWSAFWVWTLIIIWSLVGLSLMGLGLIALLGLG